jgi:IS1 family transposase
LIIKEISSGYGLHWIPRLGKLLVYILGIVVQYQKSALWNSIPPVYRQCAVIYTDHWSAYDSVLPSKRHHSVDKNSGCTSYIERFNCTIRQRVSRLVRKSLSFSKKLENPIAAIWRFVHHYNANLQL